MPKRWPLTWTSCQPALWLALAGFPSPASGQGGRFLQVTTGAHIELGPPARITITFNREVQRGLSPGTLPPGLHISEPDEWTVSWPTPWSLRLTRLSLPAGDLVVLVLDTTFTSIDGHRLQRPYRSALELRIGIAVTPGTKPGDPVVELRAEHDFPALEAGAAPPGVVLRPLVPGQWEMVDSRTLRFLADSIPRSTTFTLTVDTTFRSRLELRGHPVNLAFRFPRVFRASLARPVTASAPASIWFSAPVANAGRGGAPPVTISPPVAGVMEWASPQRARFAPAQAFTLRTTYIVRVDSTLESEGGLVFAGPTEFRFRLTAGVSDAPWNPMSIRDSLELVFNEPVRPDASSDSTPAGFSINPLLSGRFEWPKPNILRFRPDHLWDPAVIYRVTLDTTFPDPARPVFDQPWELSVRAGLVVQGRHTSLSPRRDHVLTFNLPLSDTAFVADSVAGVSLVPPGAAKYRVEGRTLTVTPGPSFRRGDSLTIRLDTALKAADGTPVSSPITVRSAIRSPRIVAAWPNSVFITPDTKLRLLLSDSVDARSFLNEVGAGGYRSPDSACDEPGPHGFDIIRERRVEPADVGWTGELRDTLLHRTGWVLFVRPRLAPRPGCNVRFLSVDMRAPGRFMLMADADSIAGDSVRTPGIVMISLPFSMPVHERDLRRHITITPPASFSLAPGRYLAPPTTWTVRAVPRPHTRYEVRVDTALRDAFGSRLVRPLRFTIRTGPAAPLIPRVWVNQTPRVVRRGGTLDVAITSVGARSFVACTAAVPDSLRIRSLTTGWWNLPMFPVPGSLEASCREYRPGPTRGDTAFTAAELPPPPGWSGLGVVAVQVLHDSLPAERGRTLRRATDLDAQFRVGRSDAQAVVRRSDGTPIDGAVVRLLDCHERLLGAARTSPGGAVHLDSLPNDVPTRRQLEGAQVIPAERACPSDAWRLATIEADADRTEYVVPWIGDDQPVPLPPAVLTAERSAYRGGDTLRLVGLVRRSQGDRLGEPVRMVITGRDPGPRYGPLILMDSTISVPSSGVVAMAIPLAAGIAAGSYKVVWVVDALGEWRELASTAFAVYDEAPADVHLSAHPSRDWVVAGDTITFALQAWLPSGAAAERRRVFWRARGMSGWGDHPPHFPAGYDTKWSGAPGSWQEEWAAEGQAVTGPDGSAHVVYPTPEGLPESPWHVTFAAWVEDSTWVERATVAVHPTDITILVGEYGSTQVAGLTNVVPVLAVDPTGAPVTGKTVRGAIGERRWSLAPQESLGLAPDGSYVLDTLSACEVVTRVEPVRCTLRSPRYGELERTLATTDSRGHPVEAQWRYVQFHEPPGFGSPPAPLNATVSLDRAAYRAGDTALAHITAPAHTAWVVLEDSTIAWSRVVALEDGAAQVKIPFAGRQAPEARVHVSFFGTGDARPALVPGAILEVPVRDPARELLVEVVPLLATIPVADSVGARVTVNGAADHEVLTVVLWALDRRDRAADPAVSTRWSARRYADRNFVSAPGMGPTPRWWDDGMYGGPDAAIDYGADDLRYAPHGRPSRSSQVWLASRRLLGIALAEPGRATVIPYSIPVIGAHDLVAVVLSADGRMGTARVPLQVVDR